MRNVSVYIAVVWTGFFAHAGEFVFEQRLDLLVDGRRWLGTVFTPYDEAHRENTYKVYTHLYDFEGAAPITKGPGGKYSHHRGLFIGWKKTSVDGRVLNVWEMPNSSQRHVAWLELSCGADSARQVERIHWCDPEGKPFIEEIRTITAQAGESGLRIFDFISEVRSLAATIQLRGDLHHAGMQVRIADEVSDHEDTTRYILPEGADEVEKDKVIGAWWVCCSPVVRDKRYWLIHMTPKDHPTGQPVYSIRRYARFGAFFEADVEEGKPLATRFRIILSDQELSRDACEALYQAYVQGQR